LEFPIAALFLRKAIRRRARVSTSDRGFEFRKNGQLFIRSHNETLSIFVFLD
jgi:hypothetical protein